MRVGLHLVTGEWVEVSTHLTDQNVRAYVRDAYRQNGALDLGEELFNSRHVISTRFGGIPDDLGEAP